MSDSFDPIILLTQFTRTWIGLFDRTTTMALLLLLPLLITTSFAGLLPSTTSTKPQSIASCTLPKDCGDKSIATEFMCLCQKVAMSAAYGGGDTSTNAGNDNSPYPGYLRNNYANDLQNGASMTICHGMVQSKLIVPKCLVSEGAARE